MGFLHLKQFPLCSSCFALSDHLLLFPPPSSTALSIPRPLQLAMDGWLAGRGRPVLGRDDVLAGLIKCNINDVGGCARSLIGKYYFPSQATL